jgi:phage gp16-like protein
MVAARKFVSPGRRVRIAKIHVAKKAMAMHDDSYRALLRRITGYDSSSACSEVELDAVLQEFKRLGFADKRAMPPLSNKAYVRKIYAIWRDLKPYLRDGSGAALRSFVQRQTRTEARPEGVASPEFLNPEDGNLVVEGLKAWLSRERKKVRKEIEALGGGDEAGDIPDA